MNAISKKASVNTLAGRPRAQTSPETMRKTICRVKEKRGSAFEKPSSAIGSLEECKQFLNSLAAPTKLNELMSETTWSRPPYTRASSGVSIDTSVISAGSLKNPEALLDLKPQLTAVGENSPTTAYRLLEKIQKHLVRLGCAAKAECKSGPFRMGSYDSLRMGASTAVSNLFFFRLVPILRELSPALVVFIALAGVTCFAISSYFNPAIPKPQLSAEKTCLLSQKPTDTDPNVAEVSKKSQIAADFGKTVGLNAVNIIVRYIVFPGLGLASTVAGIPVGIMVAGLAILAVAFIALAVVVRDESTEKKNPIQRYVAPPNATFWQKTKAFLDDERMHATGADLCRGAGLLFGVLAMVGIGRIVFGAVVLSGPLLWAVVVIVLLVAFFCLQAASHIRAAQKEIPDAQRSVTRKRLAYFSANFLRLIGQGLWSSTCVLLKPFAFTLGWPFAVAIVLSIIFGIGLTAAAAYVRPSRARAAAAPLPPAENSEELAPLLTEDIFANDIQLSPCN